MLIKGVIPVPPAKAITFLASLIELYVKNPAGSVENNSSPTLA